MDHSNPGLELFLGIVQDGMVTDESPPPPPDRVALQKAARDVVIEAMKDLEAKSYNRGFYEGWEACNERWRQMLNEATQQTQATALAASEGAASQANERAFLGEARQGQAKASDVVLGIIKERPGLRGIEIVNAAGESGQAIHERTVRTALHRMKRDGRIKNLGGRWFTADAAADADAGSDGDENDAQT